MYFGTRRVKTKSAGRMQAILGSSPTPRPQLSGLEIGACEWFIELSIPSVAAGPRLCVGLRARKASRFLGGTQWLSWQRTRDRLTFGRGQADSQEPARNRQRPLISGLTDREQERAKSCLGEMMIACQSICNIVLGHYLEADAIGEGPVFIATLPIELHPSRKPG